jgi:hypothetical protein
MKAIKEILLDSGSISHPYKAEEKEYVGTGTATIFGLSGGFGTDPKIIVRIPTIELEKGGTKEFKWSEIDEAIEIYEKLVFRKENLMYLFNKSMIQLYNEGEVDLDLDDDKDLIKVKARRDELLKEEEKSESKF